MTYEAEVVATSQSAYIKALREQILAQKELIASLKQLLALKGVVV